MERRSCERWRTRCVDPGSDRGDGARAGRLERPERASEDSGGRIPYRGRAPGISARDAMTSPQSNDPPPAAPELVDRVHRWLLLFMQSAMALSFGVALWERQWLTAMIVAGIFALMSVPTLLGRRLAIQIPAEFELLALVFVFAALFLGEVRGFYQRLWWWDIALHTTSGFLLGILGFLLVFVLNEDERVDVHLQPRFIALFACLFAIALGALWEIFEFAMDQLFGLNMQKPMLGDPSGKTDTMWDLIVDTLGALVISCLGWWYMANRRRSFIDSWIRKFVERNPRFFRT